MKNVRESFRLVFDIGKTNKKIVVFHGADTVFSETRVFDETERDGLLLIPLEEMAKWFLSVTGGLFSRYRIDTAGVCSHASAFVGLDHNRKAVVPVLSYMNRPSDPVLQEMEQMVGDGKAIRRKTCTPEMGFSINQAVGFLNTKFSFPAEFDRVASVLNFPQYFIYLLTGRMVTELTYLGSHSYLWDFTEWKWSSVAEKTGFARLAPPVVDNTAQFPISVEIKEQFTIENQVMVSTGLHDSNASLIPFFFVYGNRFCLHSTGSWCVTMMPSDHVDLTDDELDKKIFYNISAYARPVKTHSYPGGIILQRHLDAIKSILEGFDEKSIDYTIVKRLMEEKRKFMFPSIHEDNERIMVDGREYPVEAYIGLCSRAGNEREVLLKEYYALMVMGILLSVCGSIEGFDFSRTDSIIVEGGFSRNRLYTELLAAVFSDKEVVRTGLKEATAFGASIQCLDLSDQNRREVTDTISITKITPEKINAERLAAYRTEWEKIEKSFFRPV